MEGKNRDLGVFLIRLVFGLIFVVHGWMKWQDIDGTIAFFSGLGLSAMWAYVVAAIELLGGVSIILGVWQKLAGWLLAAVMIGAIYLAKGKMGFVGGYEFDLLLLATAIGLTMIPPGRYVAGTKKHHS